jgi:RNA polymerase sigma-70 factor (ECF subfamily)
LPVSAGFREGGRGDRKKNRIIPYHPYLTIRNCSESRVHTVIGTARTAKLGRQDRIADAATTAARAAFDLAWQEARPRIWRLTARMSGSPDAADDLTQEVGVRALQALPRFRGDADRKTYLYRIAVNVALRHIEERRRRGEVTVGAESLDSPSPIDSAVADASGSPESRLLLSERLPRIRAALDALPVDLRAPLILLVYEEMKYREIAAVLEIPIGTVMSRIHAARQRLRIALPEEFGNENL